MNDTPTPSANQENVETPADYKKALTTVTPLSKYLALALFILLPLGALWVGFEHGKSMATVTPTTSTGEKNTDSVQNRTPQSAASAADGGVTYSLEDLGTNCFFEANEHADAEYCDSRLVRNYPNGAKETVTESVFSLFNGPTGLSLLKTYDPTNPHRLVFTRFNPGKAGGVSVSALDAQSLQVSHLSYYFFDNFSVSPDENRIVQMSDDGRSLTVFDLRYVTATRVVDVDGDRSLAEMKSGMDGNTLIGNFEWADNNTITYSVFEYLPKEEMEINVRSRFIERRTLTL